MFSLKNIRDAIGKYGNSEVTPSPKTRQAAVAIILRDLREGPEILFIKRAEKEGDPWSGHMAFPGGHKEPEDSNLRQSAERETQEEIGVDLSIGRYLGALDHESAQPRGRVLDMLIAPHVFEVFDHVDFSINYEVDKVVWAPLGDLTGNRLHHTETMPMSGTPTVFNGYKLREGHFVWGLTYRILKSFFTAVDPTWTGPNEL